MRFGEGWRIGSIGGIDIRIDPSWLIIVALITYSFFLRFTVLYGELTAMASFVLAAGAAVLFFGSVLTHEMAHSLMAKARGIEVEGITLFLFGGATHANVEGKGPKDEFTITIVGPLTSIALAAGIGLVSAVTGVFGEPVSGALGYLAWLNLALAVFNLLPGFPLDGGRVLRSAVWAVTGDLRRATRAAARVGQGIGAGIIALGILALFAGALGGLWLAFIGWFLTQAARAAGMEVEVRERLRGVRARDVMSQPLLTVPPDATVDRAINDYFLRYDHSAFPVAENGETLGLVTLRSVRRLPPEERDRRVVDCMVPIDVAPQVGPDEPLSSVLDRLTDDEGKRILVIEGRAVLGIITPRDVARRIQRADELDIDLTTPAMPSQAR